MYFKYYELLTIRADDNGFGLTHRCEITDDLLKPIFFLVII